jgi:hypothetical protein
VVAHPTLQAQRAQAGLDEHRRARVTEGVEADAGQSGALGGGDEHAAAQAALIGRTAVATGKDDRVVDAIARPMSAQRGSALGRQRDQPCAVARLGRYRCALDDRAAHVQMRCRLIEHEVAPARADRLGDPQSGRGKQLKQRAPLRRYLVEQTHELRPRQRAALARRPCATGPPPRQHDLLGRVGIEQPSATAASSARRSGVSALAIERSHNRPARPGRVVSQSTNCCTAARSRSRSRTSRSK